jgi:DNA polymerase-3 subunit beta
MNFKCDSGLLQKSIGIAEKAISTRTTLPVLQNIFLEHDKGKLRLRGNDLEIGIESVCETDGCENDFSLLVNAKTISSIVSKLQNQAIDIKIDDKNKMIIEAGKISFDILCSAADEYPVFPNLETGIKFVLKIADLKDYIKHTLFSVCFDETKHFLNGVLLKYEDGNLYFVTTDGFRLSLKRKTIGQITNDFSIIVPYKAMNELNKIIGHLGDSDEIEVNVSDNQIAFKMQNFLLISRLIKGQFPDYKQVIPQENDNVFVIQRRIILEAAERANIIASASNNAVRFCFSNEKVAILANAPMLGDFQEEISINRKQGHNDVEIAFNVRLLIDVLKILDADDIQFQFNHGLSPCIVSAVDDEDYKYVVMPIRTSKYQNSEEEEG